MIDEMSGGPSTTQSSPACPYGTLAYRVALVLMQWMGLGIAWKLPNPRAKSKTRSFAGGADSADPFKKKKIEI